MKKSIGILSLLVITAAFIFVGFKMVDMPSTYDGAAEIIVNETQEKTGAINSVTSIVFDFRGYDTLGESFVLFSAVCGATAVLRKRRAKGVGNHEEE